jgi:GTP-binding protein
MLVSQTESHTYFGKLLIGRINAGTVKQNDKVSAVDNTGKVTEVQKVFKILRRYGMSQIEMAKAVAGDIVSIAGFSNATVNHTLNEPGKNTVIPSIPIDPPMLSITVNVNTSPLCGKEGQKVSSNHIKERLSKESENDVALRVAFEKEGFELQGRGDLHLGVLIERMRREGYEMSITPPTVVMKKEGNKILEPIEKLTIEVAHVYIPGIIENLTDRKAHLVTAEEIDSERQRIVFHVPTRGLIGLRSQLLNDTKGTVVLYSELHEYQEYKGPLKKNIKGALISSNDGVCTAYGLKELESKGTLFIRPGTKVNLYIKT